jgi:succinyl-CoA synthetase beta subunit
VPQSARAESPVQAAQSAAKIGFPVALKGEGHAHKSEVGAVKLDLRNASEVEAAARTMPARTFLVEEMVAAPVAELLIGVVADPAHGYVLTLAAGGALTELLRDSASLLVPASREDVRAALAGLRVAPLLTGYRGKPAADIETVLEAVMAVQDLVATSRPLEIEINPLMCSPDGAIAADVLIRTGDGR